MSVKPRTDTNSYGKKWSVVWFSREIFFNPQVFFIKILSSLLTLPIMRSDYTTKSRSNQITQIELVLPTFKSWTVHKIIGYLTLGLLSSLGNIYHSTTGYFFDPRCICRRPHRLCTWKIRFRMSTAVKSKYDPQSVLFREWCGDPESAPH